MAGAQTPGPDVTGTAPGGEIQLGEVDVPATPQATAAAVTAFPGQGGFVQRQLSVSFSLANGNFGGGGNSATISGVRASAKIVNAGGQSMGQLEMAIFGLPLSLMNQLTTLGTQVNFTNKNSITVMAGDAVNGMFMAFQGTISTAWVDAQAMPEVAFRVSAFAGLLQQIQPAKVTSTQGSGDVAQIMGQLAQQMGLQFENNGISGMKLSNPYLHGTLLTQARSLAEHAGIEMTVENGTLAIWKPGQARQSSSVTVSAATGMVGYPQFNQSGVVVRTIYNPNAKLGTFITVQSDLTPACGSWVVTNVIHDLDAMVPHGKWFTTMETTRIQTSAIP